MKETRGRHDRSKKHNSNHTHSVERHRDTRAQLERHDGRVLKKEMKKRDAPPPPLTRVAPTTQAEAVAHQSPPVPTARRRQENKSAPPGVAIPPPDSRRTWRHRRQPQPPPRPTADRAGGHTTPTRSHTGAQTGTVSLASAGPAAATLAGERKKTPPSRCKLSHPTQVVGATPAQVSRGPYAFPVEHAPQPHSTQDATRSGVQLQPKATVATSAVLVARHVGADPPLPTAPMASTRGPVNLFSHPLRTPLDEHWVGADQSTFGATM